MLVRLPLFPLGALAAATVAATCTHPVLASDKDATVKTIPIETLSTPGGVIGRLAVPLGQVVTIEGKVVRGTELLSKSLAGALLLHVTTVDGQRLSEPCILRFRWFPGVKAETFKDHVRLAGYESGELKGIPEEAFSHVPRTASESFHFETSFVVLKSL